MVNEKLSDFLSKRDLELVIETNKKAIQLETISVELNQEIIEYLTESKVDAREFRKELLTLIDTSFEADQETKEKFTDKIIEEIKKTNKYDEIKKDIEKISKDIDAVSKDIYKTNILIVSTVLTMILQIVQLFIKK